MPNYVYNYSKKWLKSYNYIPKFGRLNKNAYF